MGFLTEPKQFDASQGASQRSMAEWHGFRESPSAARVYHAVAKRRITMSDQDTSGGGAEDGADEPIPFMQQLLDNPFLLLFIGITVPTVFYLLWGVMEITSIPIATY